MEISPPRTPIKNILVVIEKTWIIPRVVYDIL